MNPENISQFERARKKLLTIIIGRHGPKASATGEKNVQADNFYESVSEGYGHMNIKGFPKTHVKTSPIDRAFKTAEIIREKLIEDGKVLNINNKKVTKSDSLASPYTPTEGKEDQKFIDDLEVLIDLQKKYFPDIQAEVRSRMPDDSEEEREIEARNLLDSKILAILFRDDKMAEENKIFKGSYQDIADGFGQRYAGLALHSGLLQKTGNENRGKFEKAPYLSIDISHSYPIMCFLKKYLVFDNGMPAQDMMPEDFFYKIGGVIRESGSFEINYETDENGELELIVNGEFEKGKQFSGHIDLPKLLGMES